MYTNTYQLITFVFLPHAHSLYTNYVRFCTQTPVRNRHVLISHSILTWGWPFRQARSRGVCPDTFSIVQLEFSEISASTCGSVTSCKSKQACNLNPIQKHLIQQKFLVTAQWPLSVHKSIMKWLPIGCHHLTAWACPFWHARWSGVSPLREAMFGSAPWPSNTVTAPVRPAPEAKWSGV